MLTHKRQTIVGLIVCPTHEHAYLMCAHVWVTTSFTNAPPTGVTKHCSLTVLGQWAKPR